MQKKSLATTFLGAGITVLGTVIFASGLSMFVGEGAFASNNYRRDATRIRAQIPDVIEKRDLINRGVYVTMPQINSEIEEKLCMYDYYKSQEHYHNNLGMCGIGVAGLGVIIAGLGYALGKAQESD